MADVEAVASPMTVGFTAETQRDPLDLALRLRRRVCSNELAMKRGLNSASQKRKKTSNRLSDTALEVRPISTAQSQLTDAPKSATSAARLRGIPSVDEMLGRPRLRELSDDAGRGIVTQATRSVLADVRAKLVKEASEPGVSGASPARPETAEALEERIANQVKEALAPSLRRVINATGVVLHTNLGRAPLSAAAVSEIQATATGYSNLEYDVEGGQRGKRDVHTARLLAQLAGSEAAIVVNNNAAAVFLVLNTLAKGAEVIVSRGELIEIGDGFRIPDIMAESGAVLREVGTTNRTGIRDYERAMNERTRLLLRVHPSNFRITGFTERPPLGDLVALGLRNQIPLYEDLGSGCPADLSEAGISEPVVRASCEAGASIVSFSGDKLLGGPQAGIIAGKKELVERIRRNPLVRALRVDKLTIAALEATLRAYLRGAFDEIPALRKIRTTREELGRRAERFAEGLRAQLSGDISVELRDGSSVIGGGSTPDEQLATKLIRLRSERHSAVALEERLRKPMSGVPVIARIEEDWIVFDLRTVFPEEESSLAAAIAAAAVD